MLSIIFSLNNKLCFKLQTRISHMFTNKKISPIFILEEVTTMKKKPKPKNQLKVDKTNKTFLMNNYINNN